MYGNKINPSNSQGITYQKGGYDKNSLDGDISSKLFSNSSYNKPLSSSSTSSQSSQNAEGVKDYLSSNSEGIQELNDSINISSNKLNISNKVSRETTIIAKARALAGIDFNQSDTKLDPNSIKAAGEIKVHTEVIEQLLKNVEDHLQQIENLFGKDSRLDNLALKQAVDNNINNI